VRILNSLEIKKRRAFVSGHAIVRKLEGIEPENLIFELYLPAKDEDTKVLIAFVEKQLVKAIINPDDFLKTRYKDVKKIISWIKANKKYKLFCDFSMYVSRNLQQNYNILCAYQDVLLNLWELIAPVGKYWYGLDENEKPLLMDQLYPDYDVECFKKLDEMKKIKDPIKRKIKVLELVDYDKSLDLMRFNERNIGNVIFNMIGLINKDNEDFIFPKDGWFDHTLPLSSTPRVFLETEFFLDLLDKRSYFIPTKGIILDCLNCGSIKEIRFKEEFLEDGLIVLFKFSLIKDGKSSMGFIDLRNRYFFSCWQTANDEGMEAFEAIKNFILEVYCALTCEYEQQNSNDSVKILESLSELQDIEDNRPLLVVREIKKTKQEEKEFDKGQKQGTHRKYHSVRFHRRKGNASKYAKANARMYGIILPQGYTFVKDHSRGKLK